MSRRAHLAAGGGRLAVRGLRWLGRGATVGGGHVFLALAPRAVGELVPGGGCVVVSGTNGKTTTTALLAAAIGSGATVVTNVGGANLRSGIANALIASPNASVAVLEVDEGVLPDMLGELRPEVAVLLNLSRDQLDRYAEVRHTADRWRTALRAMPDIHVVANADDPMIVWAAGAVQSASWVSGGCSWLEDASACPHCARPLLHSPGSWGCGCGFARPATDPLAESEGIALPGLCNRSNATMALAAARRFGSDDTKARQAMGTIDHVSGRYAMIQVGDTSARLLLAKNPAAWLEVLSLFESEPDRPLVLLLSAEIADGRDPSWLWDVPFERLRGRRVFVGGPRAADMAVRLAYAEVAHVSVQGSAIDVIAAAGTQGTTVEVAATYSMFASLAPRASSNR